MRVLFSFILLSFLLPTLAIGSLLSERTYKRLGQIHKLIEKNDYSGALARLDKLMNQSGSRGYDKAVIQQTYGYVYEAMEQPAKAVETFKSSLDSGELPPTAAQGIRINLASLYYGSGKTKQALDMFEKWYELNKKPSPQALVFGGSLYAENEDYNKAVSLINRAINLSRNPKETWYRRIAAIYLKKEDYTNASKILEILITQYSEKVSYWKQLSASYYFSGNKKKALSIMLLAYKKELLKTEKEILDLARLATLQNIPLQGSQIIEDGVKKGVVSKNKENMELLGNIYIQAREYDRAVQSFEKSAIISKDPETYMKMAKLYGDSHQWNKALKVLDEHLADEMQSNNRVLILKGIALYESGRIAESRRIFEQASTKKENVELASSWLKYMKLISAN